MALTAHDGERYVAHVLPLSSGERRRAGIAYTAVAAMFVRKTAAAIPIVRRSHRPDLQADADRAPRPACRRRGGSVPEVAQVLGVAETTVKFHLGNIYAKTGANRQTALVKLVAGFSNSLIGLTRDVTGIAPASPVGGRRAPAFQHCPAASRHEARADPCDREAVPPIAGLPANSKGDL